MAKERKQRKTATKAEAAPPLGATVPGFSVDVAEMSKALSVVLPCVERGSINPLYTSVLLDADDGDLWITGCNGTTFGVSRCGYEGQPAKWHISGHALADFLKLAGSERIDFEQEGGRCVLRYGKSWHKLPIVDGEFPDQGEVSGPTFEMPADLLRRMIGAVEFAIGRNVHGDPKWRGFQMLGDGKHLRLVASDGVRVAVASHSVEAEGEATVPLDSLPAILNFLRTCQGAVEIVCGQNQVCFRAEPGYIVSGMLVDKYPDWQKALFDKMKLDKHVTASVSALAKTMRRASLAAGSRDNEAAGTVAWAFKFRFQPDKIIIEARDEERHLEGCDEVVAETNLSEEMAIGIAGKQLMDFLSAVDVAHVVCEFDNADKAMGFRPAESPGFEVFLVQMPVRLRW
jgi:DNA polymerase-3 subunit beta